MGWFDKAPVHPPKPFDTWRLNLYAMKNNSGVAWSPILGQGNFHQASRFGKVTWSVPGMTPPPSAAASDGAGMASTVDGGPLARPRVMRPMVPRLPHPPSQPR